MSKKKPTKKKPAAVKAKKLTKKEQKHVRRLVVEEIDALIEEFGTTLNNDDYLDAMAEMVDRAQTALDARQEELDKDEPDPEDDDEDA